MVFPQGGPIARHPSQLYESLLEGVLLFVVLYIMVRRGALERTGLVSGAFMIGYGIARIVAEFFREPDPFLSFVLPGTTMGQLLSRSEEHTSELQSLMRISYAVFCLKKKKKNETTINY